MHTLHKFRIVCANMNVNLCTIYGTMQKTMCSYACLSWCFVCLCVCVKAGGKQFECQAARKRVFILPRRTASPTNALANTEENTKCTRLKKIIYVIFRFIHGKILQRSVIG